MKKHFLLFILSIISFQEIFATHTKGGWMYYEYLGAGISDPAKIRYKVGIKFYMDCHSNIIENTFAFSIFGGTTPFTFMQDVNAPLVTNVDIQNCRLSSCYPCINVIPDICYKIITYETVIELAPSINGYIISKQRCCRVNGISNLQSPSNTLGATYSIKIPGVNAGVINAQINSSPLFIFKDTSIICGNNPFTFNSSATDANGDSLVYSFCNALDGGSTFDPIPIPASNPPYASVPYSSPYSGSQPLGPGVTINPVTGIISGIAPSPGEYVISVCVSEYRNGIRFAESRKELHIYITNCNPVAATLSPAYVTCGDLNLSFSNLTDNAAIQNWFWVFGDPASGASDSSTSQFPSHTFSTAGVYNVKLYVNRGLGCVDSAFQNVSVFPGFFPGFQVTSPLCVGAPIQFQDTTHTNYGTVSNWSWNFGDPSTLADTSHLANPTYTYNTAGNYTIKLVVKNSKGCIDTTTRNIIIQPLPIVSVFPRDTTYCGQDSVRLTATGNGTFSWSPSTFISGNSTASPLVFPSGPATYMVTLNAGGCLARDSARLNPLNDLTTAIAANPALICQGDTLQLTGNANHANISWQWTPVNYLASPTSQVTSAFPPSNQTYTLQARWGNNCVATATKNIAVTPLAIPNAGADTGYCSGQAGVTLQASGGSSYQWFPVAGLSNANISNPVATPPTTTTYYVSVGVSGCPGRRVDSVIVTARPRPQLQMPRDTLICVIDTLRLQATGTGTFTWSPGYNIDNVNTSNPLVSPDVPTRYRLHLQDMFGCFRDDSVFIDVKPDVTVHAGNDTSLCRSESVLLATTGDGISYSWTPVTGLNNPLIKNPVATPPVTTIYTVTANIGKCQRSSSVQITVAPLPAADAGPDLLVCSGFNAQLTATGGSRYRWRPVIYLTDSTSSHPQVIQPVRTTRYIVTVTDTLGCKLSREDTVYVQVIPHLQVDAGPADTSIAAGEPLNLQATGALTYLWTPGSWLNSPFIANPVSTTPGTILYRLTGMDATGCLGYDSILVRVFDLVPDMFVPTAFTPNGDGINDIFRPIMIGMKSLVYFKVYNRFGQLVYATTKIGEGWNGIYAGKAQDMANFVWVAEGETYKGERRKKKGNVILIR